MRILLIALILLCSTAYAWEDDGTILVEDRGVIVLVDTRGTGITQVGGTTVYKYGDDMTGINHPDGSQTWIYKNN